MVGLTYQSSCLGCNDSRKQITAAWLCLVSATASAVMALSLVDWKSTVTLRWFSRSIHIDARNGCEGWEGEKVT